MEWQGDRGPSEMPTYNVRMNVGDDQDEGEPMEFPDTVSACRDAQVAMAELARDKIPGESQAHLAVEIYDHEGKPVYRAELDFKGRAGDSQPDLDVASQLSLGPRE